MMASVMGGLRWVLCQIVLHKAELGLNNPIDTVYHVAPCMGLAMLPFAIGLEGKALLLSPMLFQVRPVAALPAAANSGLAGREPSGSP